MNDRSSILGWLAIVAVCFVLFRGCTGTAEPNSAFSQCMRGNNNGIIMMFKAVGCGIFAW